MPGKPAAFQMPDDVFSALPDQAKGHLPPATFDAALAAVVPDHPAAGDHFAPHADVTLPADAADALDQHGTHIPSFVTDWLL
ncbi:MAG: hypothetical protein E5X74_30345 [Mesorhizobium sp.]|uniref:hypothetical protein n=1 Tax=Mesorhizobium sp. TaxID=1871066 RepID=UPI000FE819B8|nr:hypothetical protein [Mesorhizobium sp.]RWM20061.1 MAG: hypothetical protein EOR74_31580 [Mesorhizobium sp.]TIO73082.1 MAG: hypothetical protein E5X75_29865 [Mesorhizobium sp.]TIO81086.1 MAG: hypothetical protein E5X74_30345 [Mesorhizobium sp.]